MSEEAGERIRAYLPPFWERLHRADLRFHAIAALPDPLSTALCRHTTLFALLALAAAGQAGWRAVDGAVVRDAMAAVPGYARDKAEARHCWLASRAGWLDLSADQFGLGRVLWGPPGSDLFVGHRARDGRPPLRSLLRTVRAWEGDPAGRWGPADQAAIRPLYEALVKNLAATAR